MFIETPCSFMPTEYVQTPDTVFTGQKPGTYTTSLWGKQAIFRAK